MNQAEFEREALRIFEEIGYENHISIANALREMILKDLAENNPPVYYANEHGVVYEVGECEIEADFTPLYAKPPIQQAPEGWQPIETAPKDGTYILIMTVTGRNYVVAYDSTFSIPWRVMFDVGISEFVPTHWMPLPAAPEYKEE